MATATLVKKATEGLVRGGKVKISDSYDNEEVHNKKVVIRSKGTVPCNKKGRCADESKCVGLALFVEDPTYVSEGDEAPTGWRTGTLKICLTHLRTTKGAPIIPNGAEASAPSRGPGRPPKAPSMPNLSEQESVVEDMSFGVSPEILPSLAAQAVTWESLAQASADRDPEKLSFLARKLKAENEMLVRRLIEAQHRVISAMART